MIHNEIIFNENEYYSKYTGQVVVLRESHIVNDEIIGAWKREREKFLLNGELPKDATLIQCGIDELKIEFENHAPKKDINNKIIKNENGKIEEIYISKEKINEFINVVKNNCKKHNLSWCETSHNGKSNYITIANLKNIITGHEPKCKLFLALELITPESEDFLDKSNFGNNTLVPVINKPHWKKTKYNGEIHKIIDGVSPNKHENFIPQKVLDKIRKKIEDEEEEIKIFDNNVISEVNKIPLQKVINIVEFKHVGNELQGVNPWHGSSSGTNFNINLEKNLWHCWRCEINGENKVGGSTVKAIALNEGFIDNCSDIITKEISIKVRKIAEEKYGLQKNDAIYDIVNIKKNTLTTYNLETLEKLSNICISLILDEKISEATELITEFIKKSNKIYTTKNDFKSEIWIYDNGIYTPNGGSKIKEITRQILKSLYTTQKVNLVISKIEADTFIDEEIFFKFKIIDEIPVLNGILNLKTLELLPYTQEKIFFNKLPIYYDKDATCPNIDNFLKEVLHKEDIPFFYELCGYCLYKDYPIEKAFMFHGEGRNGKGKIILLIKHFLGIENCTSVPLQRLNLESFSISELFSKLVNLAGDLSEMTIKETGTIKSLTGRDVISGKRKFLRDLTFENYCKQIFACNSLPAVYDTTLGWWSRWILIDFPHTFLSQEEFEKLENNPDNKYKLRDVNIINKITTKEELSGLLNKALGGLHNILKHQDFTYSKSSTEVRDMWVRKSNSFIAFCSDMIEEDDNNVISKQDLRKAFSKYCRKYKLKSTSDKSISISLENLYGVTSLFPNSYGNTTGDYAWKGIKLREKTTG